MEDNRFEKREQQNRTTACNCVQTHEDAIHLRTAVELPREARHPFTEQWVKKGWGRERERNTSTYHHNSCAGGTKCFSWLTHSWGVCAHCDWVGVVGYVGGGECVCELDGG